jgi:peptide/nickel transport system permease protein
LAGLGRVMAVQVINNLLILIIIVAIISAIFVFYSEQVLEGVIIEATNNYARQLAKNPHITDEQREALIKQFEYNMRMKYGLLGNPVQRIYNMMKNLLTLDLGNARQIYLGDSYSVKDQVLFALKNTAILFTTATVIISFLGLGLGLYAARRPQGLLDRTISFLAIFSSSLPTWWLGMLVLLVFAFKLHWFPFQSKDVYIALAALSKSLNAGQISYPVYLLLKLKTWIYYMFLPLITIVTVGLGGWSYVVRNIVIGKMTEDFVMVARAKGLPERKVLFGHVLRASSPPLLTIIVLSLVNSLGGAIITETVFGWPGMGLLYWQAITNSETLLLAANVYVTILLFVIAVIILNMLYAIMDPRVRTGAAGVQPVG